MKNLSFREMSALGTALAVALMAYLYFPHALILVDRTGSVAQGSTLIGYGIGVVSVLVVLQIIYHIIISILWRRDAGERLDERDRTVSLKAGRFAYCVLLVALFLLAGYLMFGSASNLLVAQYALMVLFAGEFVRYCATFIYYRLSA